MKLIDNTQNQINWDEVIEKLKTCQGTTLNYNTTSFDPSIPGFSELDVLWKEAGYFYDDPSIAWTNFFPGRDFEQSVVDTFASIVNAKPWMVWISKICPGQMAPWHFDAHTKIDEIKALGTPVRFTCYIQNPSHGHVSIVGEDAIYRPAKGSIYQWPTFDAWHCGMNGGLTDKFMFNFWGYR
jgi:hypothetical protein